MQQILAEMGSSPLARGTLRNEVDGLGNPGLIPARAGNTTLPCSRIPIRRAHPRSRGEHFLVAICLYLWAGLIPARAGNTWLEWCRCYCRRAHPRSRGEHCLSWWLVKMSWGSSPLARGTPRLRQLNLLSVGLIPARAGNTVGTFPNLFLLRAHPRSRGEHHGGFSEPHYQRGSSPLARGTRRVLLPEVWRLGLIPARAGNTVSSLCLRANTGAHPRSRGEHFILSARLLWRMGSSPLARGTLCWRSSSNARSGLIPARAGNTEAWKN